MPESSLSSVLLVLLLLVGFAQLLGYLFVKLRQPKVVGEIAAGILLGPALLGRIPYIANLIDTTKHQGNILDFVYWMGLLLLMFPSRSDWFSGPG
jgi:Kef-type K+ transport system membrane component KefB